MFPSAGDTSHRQFPGTQRSVYTAPTREVFTAHPFEGLHREVVQCLTSRRSNDALSSARAMLLSFSDAAFCHFFPYLHKTNANSEKRECAMMMTGGLH